MSSARWHRDLNRHGKAEVPRFLVGTPLADDGIDGVLGALRRAEGKIEFIQARHEEMAAFMAAEKIDLPAMFKDVAGAFVQQASEPSQVRHLIDRAIRTALGERAVTAIVLPNDLQEESYEEPARAHGTVHSGVGFRAPMTIPYQEDLKRAADLLNEGKKVAMLVGAGALSATDGRRPGDRCGGRRRSVAGSRP